jgi:hypothetical protein
MLAINSVVRFMSRPAVRVHLPHHGRAGGSWTFRLCDAGSLNDTVGLALTYKHCSVSNQQYSESEL